MTGRNAKKSKLLQAGYIYFIIISLIIIFISYQLYSLQNRLSQSIIQVVYNQTEATLQNISQKIKDKPYEKLDEYLSIMLSKDIKRIFVLLYKNGLFYSIKDLPHSKTHTPRLFMPNSQEKQAILKAISTNLPQVKYHNTLFDVGFSIYYPMELSYDGKVYKGVVVVDYKLSTLKKLVSDVRRIRIAIISVDLVSIAVLIMILILFLKARYYKISSYTDALTTLPNRKILKDLAKEFKDGMVIAMADIDYFKRINDTYGHDVGDIVLKEVANTIKSSIRENDIVIRYGGEEFLIVLDYAISKECVVNTLEWIRKKVESLEIPVGDKILKVTISIGVCLKAENFEDCIKKADIALYKAKGKGRNKVEVYEENV